MKDTIIKSLQELKKKGRRIIFFRWVSATSEGSIKYLNVDKASVDDINAKAGEIEAELKSNNANTLYISSDKNGHSYTRTIRL